MSKPATVKYATPTLDNDGLALIDVDALIEGKLLVTASSGGGKSWGVRRILEQTHGHAQHIVLDKDGEFHTLRERFDYVLFGDRGDFPVIIDDADRKKTNPLHTYAGRVAIRLLELGGTSAIIDLSSLGKDQDLWVKWFVESMNMAPRDLWHAAIVVIDEIHRFAPESGRGEARSTDAVKEMATDGRKRGHGLIAATQRTAELHNTVIAMMHSQMIGLNVLHDDISRARKSLGMKPSEAERVLPDLEPGQFFVRGPAFTSRKVQQIRVGSVVTTHPKAGARVIPPAPAPNRVRQVFGRLSESLQAPVEESTVPALQERVRELEAKLASVTAIDDIAVDDLVKGSNAATQEIFRAREAAAKMEAELRDTISKLEAEADADGQRIETIVKGIDEVLDKLTNIRNLYVDDLQREIEAESTESTPAPAPPSSAVENGEIGGLPLMHRQFLTVLAMRGCTTRKRILLYTVRARSGNTDGAFADLSRDGYVDGKDPMIITRKGLDALGAWNPLPRDKDLRDQIIHGMSTVERNLFAALCKEYPGAVTKADALKSAGYKRSGNTDQAFARMKDRIWILESRHEGKTFVAVNPELYT